MSKRSLTESELHPKVLDKLTSWGRAITKRRTELKLTQSSLGERIGITNQTLGRIEAGDPTVRVASYLTAMMVLDLLNELTPTPEASLTDLRHAPQRVRNNSMKGEDEYF